MEITKRTVTTITELESADGSGSGETTTEIQIRAQLAGGEVYELEPRDGRLAVATGEAMRMLAFSHRNRYLDSLDKRPEHFAIPESALRGMLQLLDGEHATQVAVDLEDAADGGDGPLYDDEG